jgi:hypothetical protein
MEVRIESQTSYGLREDKATTNTNHHEQWKVQECKPPFT